MELLELIDGLEELVIQARRLPMGGNLVVDRRRMLDLIDQLRLAVPSDLRQAAQIIETREQILEDARRQAQSIIDEALSERRALVDQHAIVIEAEERGQSILEAAERQARDTVAEGDATAAQHLSEAAEAATRQMDDADQYALELLRRLSTQLGNYLDSVRASMESLEERRD